MKKTYKINLPKIKVECPTCKGTGLFAGCCEAKDAAVVCSHCKGKGWVFLNTLEVNNGEVYTIFTTLNRKRGVIRIYESSCGYGVMATDYTVKKEDEDEDSEVGKVYEFSKYGVLYKDWLKGKKPIPMKQLYCPYVYDNRGVGSGPCSRCEEGMGEHMSMNRCKYFRKDHEKCWEEYEKSGKAKYLK
ncbi:MAG: hypothetical protein WCW65_02715 [Candidatus Paceibacterota bacterium]